MSTLSFDYTQEAQKVEQVLRRAFPENTIIETEPGYQGRVRVKLVPSRLNGKSEREKQDDLWEILRAELREEAQSVSYVIAYGTDEL